MGSQRCPRRRLIGVLAVLTIVSGAALVWRWLVAPKKEPTALQIMARPASRRAPILVSPNVQISKDDGPISHRECLVGADPFHPERLFACAMCKPHSIVGYRSEDNGEHWEPSFRSQLDPKQDWSDPSLAFGPDGILFLVCMKTEDRPVAAGKGTVQDPRVMAIYRSEDCGKAWQLMSRTSRIYMDRPWVAVDGSSGRYRGRLYCASYSEDLVLDVSADNGKTLAARTIPVPRGREWFPSNPVTFSDGSVATGLRIWTGDPDDRPQFRVLLSEDGGQTLQERSPVPTYWYDKRIKTSNFWFFPQMAADSASPRYRDRLYVVWEDGSPPELVRILFAFSPDRGKSWVGPTIISEQPVTSDRNQDYGAYMPAIAVSRQGIVAVSWYDRRGLPVEFKSKRSPGCNVRLRISQDGGEIWQPSVQVNEQTIKAPCDQLGETAGLASDAAGDFHLVWIDDRNGTKQVWTARARVE